MINFQGFILNVLLVCSMMAVCISLGVFYLLYRKQTNSVYNKTASKVTPLLESLPSEFKYLETLLANPEKYASKNQLNFVNGKIIQINEDIDSTREKVNNTEELLNDKKLLVEQKENIVDRLKKRREIDSSKLDKINTNFVELSYETNELEKNLAESIVEINRIESESDFTPEQTHQLNTFTNILKESRDRLNELTEENHIVNNQLKTLGKQYKKLEGEYSKLVEEQFA